MASERVRLRPLHRNDRDLLYEWITDRDLLILNAPYAPISERAHEDWFESVCQKRGDLAIFVIELLESRTPIGTCQLLNINWVHRSADLQIRLGSAGHHGKGLGTEAVRLLVQFGFRDLNLHRIQLRVFASNERAIRAYEKAGFEKEGVLRHSAFIDGEWLDSVVMATLRQERPADAT